MIETPLSQPAFTLAFLAGVASFLSPCIFPLIPGYLSAISAKNSRSVMPSGGASLLFPTLFFVSGFSIVFSLLGTSASFFGSFLSSNREILSTVSGSLIMILGLFTMEVVKIPFLQKETARIQIKSGRSVYVFLLGCAFAIGWTPCIGPMLASILSYASFQEPGRGFFLLLVYSLGIGMPFILTGLFFSRWRTLSHAVRNYYPFYKYIVGSMMVIVGFLMSADLLFYLNIYGQRVFELLGIDFWEKI